jgi:hypothetical protein
MLEFQFATVLILFYMQAASPIPVLLVFIVGIVIAAVFFLIWKSISKSDTHQQHSTVAAKTARQEIPRTKPHVSLCPVCHTSYTDPNLRFCLSDGTLLFLRPQDKSDYDSEATLLSPKL